MSIDINLQDLSDDTIIKSRDVAAMLGVSKQTLRSWYRSGCGPALLRIGKRMTGVRARDLRAFIATRRPA